MEKRYIYDLYAYIYNYMEFWLIFIFYNMKCSSYGLPKENTSNAKSKGVPVFHIFRGRNDENGMAALISL
jgi:hypothetical protein